MVLDPKNSLDGTEDKQLEARQTDAAPHEGRKCDRDSRLSRVSAGRLDLMRLQDAALEDFGKPIPQIDDAIGRLLDAEEAIARRYAEEPAGYDAEPSAADKEELTVESIRAEPWPQEQEVRRCWREDDRLGEDDRLRDAELRSQPHVEQAVRAFLELRKALELACAAHAPHVHRLQLHVAEAAFCHRDPDKLGDVYATLRGRGANYYDIDEAVQWVARERQGAGSSGAISHDLLEDEDSPAELRHYIRRAASPYLENLPSDAEIDNLVMNQCDAAPSGRPARGAEHSKRSERYEDLGAFLGRSENAETIRDAIKKHRAAIRRRLKG